MKQPALFIKEIAQKDNHTFSIDWSDGNSMNYRLCDLQSNCPCAKCRSEPISVNPEVKAERITSVGRYAIRITFTSGCSNGIYSYAMLQEMNKGLHHE